MVLWKREESLIWARSDIANRRFCGCCGSRSQGHCGGDACAEGGRSAHTRVWHAVGRHHAERREGHNSDGRRGVAARPDGVDHRGQRNEFASKALDQGARRDGVHLDFIHPGRPVESGYIESFNGKLRDERQNVELFLMLAHARRKLYLWRRDYNSQRPRSGSDRRRHAAAVATQRRPS